MSRHKLARLGGRAGFLLSSLLLGALWAAGPSACLAVVKEETKVFDVPPGTRVRITNQDGPVRVNAWNQPQVRLIARKRAQAWTSESERKLLSLMEVRAEMRGPDVVIEGRVERFAMIGWASYTLELEVTVPRKTDVQVRCDDGHISITGVQGSIHARSRDGHIEARDLEGDLSFSTADGHLTLEDVNGNLRAESSDGHIRYRGRADRLNLRTSDGHIRAEILPGSKMTGSWAIRTSDGSIDLLLPRDLAATLDADTRDGRVAVDLPGVADTSRRRSRFTGKLNAGGSLLSVHSGDGSIHIGAR